MDGILITVISYTNRRVMVSDSLTFYHSNTTNFNQFHFFAQKIVKKSSLLFLSWTNERKWKLQLNTVNHRSILENICVNSRLSRTSTTPKSEHLSNMNSLKCNWIGDNNRSQTRTIFRHLLPIEVTESGFLIDTNPLHSANAKELMKATVTNLDQ